MTAPMTADNFLDRICERKSLAKGRVFAHLHELARDAPRGRFFAHFAEEAREIFLAVFVDDFGSGQLLARIHPHIQRPIALETETALGVFELSRRNAQIKDRAADLCQTELIEHGIGVAEIRLSKSDAIAVVR